MTLSPVFRSTDAVAMLEAKGYLAKLRPSIDAQRRSLQILHELIEDVIDARYLAPARTASDDMTFLQDHFFLTLFDSVFRSLGCAPDRLTVYALLNLCIKGLIVSGDNLFDNETKMELPLDLGGGPRFASIVQMLCYDHLVMRILEEHADQLGHRQIVRYRRELLSDLAFIGTLEGSEEAGIHTVLPVEEMIKGVHEVRGGRLFALSFIAPRIWEPPAQQDRWHIAQRGIARLGTAFQIVDDLTDFEFDLTRRSHNVLFAQIVHAGTEAERTAFARLAGGDPPQRELVESTFVEAARAVLDRARLEAQRGFADLAHIGFWFPPEDAQLFVRAIAGDAGDDRIDAVLAAAKPAVP